MSSNYDIIASWLITRAQRPILLTNGFSSTNSVPCHGTETAETTKGHKMSFIRSGYKTCNFDNSAD